jgi:hypothetical protein
MHVKKTLVRHNNVVTTSMTGGAQTVTASLGHDRTRLHPGTETRLTSGG